MKTNNYKICSISLFDTNNNNDAQYAKNIGIYYDKHLRDTRSIEEKIYHRLEQHFIFGHNMRKLFLTRKDKYGISYTQKKFNKWFVETNDANIFNKKPESIDHYHPFAKACYEGLLKLLRIMIIQFQHTKTITTPKAAQRMWKKYREWSYPKSQNIQYRHYRICNQINAKNFEDKDDSDISWITKNIAGEFIDYYKQQQQESQPQNKSRKPIANHSNIIQRKRQNMIENEDDDVLIIEPVRKKQRLEVVRRDYKKENEILVIEIKELRKQLAKYNNSNSNVMRMDNHNGFVQEISKLKQENNELKEILNSFGLNMDNIAALDEEQLNELETKCQTGLKMINEARDKLMHHK